MLMYATEIPLDPNRSPVELLALARQWLVGSPKYSVTHQDLPPDPDGEILELKVGNHRVAVGRVVDGPSEVVGFRHTVTESDRRDWTMEIVGARATGEFWCSVRVSCDTSVATPQLPRSKKPHIIKQLLELGVGTDGGLQVSDKPDNLDEVQISRAVALIRGSYKNRLPVVYVSSNGAAMPSVDPVRLARTLSGLAHVAVEPSRWFSFRLRDEVNAVNAYAGAVGIYWPGGTGRRDLLLSGDFPTPAALESAVVERVEQALLHRRPTAGTTWGWLQEVVSRQRVAKLKASGSKNLEQYIEQFDQEVNAKAERIREMEAEIQRLRVENDRLENLCKAPGALLATGKEADLYPGERRDLLVMVLKDALKVLRKDGRRMTLVNDVIQANTAAQGLAPEYLADRIKAVFDGYRKLSGEQKRELEAIGFSVTEDGKHYKLVFQGDTRYTFTAAKTPSDHRSGANTVSQINRVLF